VSLSAWILSAGFASLAACGVPFAFAIAAAVIAVLSFSGIAPELLPQTMFAGTQSFSLLGIPFFMLAGELMTAGGLSRRLIAVADVFVRHLPGGMGLVVILAAVVFAAISGSAPATTAAVGTIMIPAMVARGYSKAFAASLCVSAGVLAPLIPPSIAFIIWGVIAEQSITRLFLSGVLPGLGLATCLAAYVLVKCRRDPKLERLPRATWPEVVLALRGGIWALLAPVIILGGIYSGIFTPTEASAVACIYALFVGFVIERRLTVAQLPGLVLNAMKITAIVMAVVIMSNGFGVLVAQEQLAHKLAAALHAAVQEKWLVLLLLNLAFFLLAAVMDEVAIMVILGPLLIGIARQFGVDPTHFGAIIVTNVAIGMAAPPIGYCLFIGMAIARLNMIEISRAIWPQVLLMVGVLMVVTYVPAFSLALVR
jgi:C4-dicarboxylate transporter, DctM subunit